MSEIKNILKKYKADINHPDYIALKELTKKNPGYLSQFIKYKFEHNASLESIKYLYDKIIFLRGIKISISDYYSCDELMDYLIEFENNRNINKIVSELPAKLRMQVDSKFKIFIKSHLEYSKAIITFFKQRSSAYNAINDLIEGIKSLLENTINNSIEKIKDKIKTLNLNCTIIHEDSYKLILDIRDFEAANTIGTPNWCISRESDSFSGYVKRDEIVFKRQIFIYNFSLERSHPHFLIGATIDGTGKITACHDQNNNVVIINAEFMSEYGEFLYAISRDEIINNIINSDIRDDIKFNYILNYDVVDAYEKFFNKEIAPHHLFRAVDVNALGIIEFIISRLKEIDGDLSAICHDTLNIEYRPYSADERKSKLSTLKIFEKYGIVDMKEKNNILFKYLVLNDINSKEWLETQMIPYVKSDHQINYANLDVKFHDVSAEELLILSLEYDLPSVAKIVLEFVKEGKVEIDKEFFNLQEFKNSFMNACVTKNKKILATIFLSVKDFDPTFDNNILWKTACKYGKLEIFSILYYDERVDIAVDNNYAFRYAVTNNQYEIAHALLNNEKININDCNGFAFRLALERGNIRIINLLMNHERFVMPEIDDDLIGRTALSDNIDLFELVLSHYDDYNLNNPLLLLQCANSGCVNILTYLLEKMPEFNINWNNWCIIFSYFKYYLTKVAGGETVENRLNFSKFVNTIYENKLFNPNIKSTDGLCYIEVFCRFIDINYRNLKEGMMRKYDYDLAAINEGRYVPTVYEIEIRVGYTHRRLAADRIFTEKFKELYADKEFFPPELPKYEPPVLPAFQ